MKWTKKLWMVLGGLSFFLLFTMMQSVVSAEDNAKSGNAKAEEEDDDNIAFHGNQGDEDKKYRAAAELGVAYLKVAQNKDGSWGRDYKPPYAPKGDVGITSFILYSLLINPDVNAGVRNADWFKKGIAWLIKHQREDGAFTNDDGEFENYRTSLAVQTLVLLDKDKYKSQIDKATKFILNQQFADKNDPVKFGGIGYGDHPRPDMSNSSMALDALKAAGYDMNSPQMKNLLSFIRRCQDDPEVNDMQWAQTGQASGGAIYRPAESKAGQIEVRGGKKSWRAYGSMTYAMFKSYIYLNLKKDSPELKGALRWIRNEYSIKENPGMGQKGWYYYAHTMAKALRAYGDAFAEPVLVDANGDEHDWAAELADELVSRQQKDGSWVNSYSRFMESNPMLVTAYAISTLGECRRFMAEREEFKQ